MTGIEDINFTKIAIKFSKNLSKDIVFCGIRDLIQKIGEIASTGASMSIEMSIGKIVAKHRAIHMLFDPKRFPRHKIPMVEHVETTMYMMPTATPTSILSDLVEVDENITKAKKYDDRPHEIIEPPAAATTTTITAITTKKHLLNPPHLGKESESQSSKDKANINTANSLLVLPNTTTSASKSNTFLIHSELNRGTSASFFHDRKQETVAAMEETTCERTDDLQQRPLNHHHDHDPPSLSLSPRPISRNGQGLATLEAPIMEVTTVRPPPQMRSISSSHLDVIEPLSPLGVIERPPSVADLAYDRHISKLEKELEMEVNLEPTVTTWLFVISCFV